MDQTILRQLETPLAKELAETLLLEHDMQTSMAVIKLWHEKFAEKEVESEERIIGASLFRDAIILFVGCFDKTAEFQLSVENVYGTNSSSLTSFQWFKDIRDAYAAHKFGAQRQCVVGVIQHPQAGIGIGQLMAAYKGQLKSDGPQLIAFMQITLDYLDKAVVRLRDTLLEEAKKMTPEQISALKIAQVRTLSQDEARISRSALQKALSARRPPDVPRK